MILIPAGEFLMGGGQEPDSTPIHKVRVDAFYIDRNEVTQEIYQRFMNQNPSRHTGMKNPVERVRWTDAIKFCNIRSQEEGLTPCYDLTTWQCDFAADGYRLPTEAEWEYACRAGSESDYHFPGGPEQLEKYGWFKNNARRNSSVVAVATVATPWGRYQPPPNLWCDEPPELPCATLSHGQMRARGAHLFDACGYRAERIGTAECGMRNSEWEIARDISF